MTISGTARAGNDRAASLLERDEEVHRLGEAIASAADGRGSLLFVEGPAGIGKTRLLAEAARLAARAGFLVRKAQGGEMERDMPFGIARQLFESLIERASEEQSAAWLSGNARQALAALGRLDPGSSDPGVEPFAPVNGLYWLTANLSDVHPVLLIVDDAHWADANSLRFIMFLSRRLADLPVCLVVGARTGEVEEPSELKALRAESPILRPQPLSLLSVHQLIAERVGQPPSDEFSAACATATAGNPFLVVEILRELGAAGGKLDASATESIADLAPESVARAVLFRLGRFGDEAIELARAIAVLGRAPQLRHAAQLAGLTDERAASICDRLREAEVLAPGLPLEFVHPLVRQAIYREQSEAQRSATHQSAAQVLSSTGAGSLDVAGHLLTCAPNGDQWVVEQLRAAAREATQGGSPDGAVTYLERALQEPPDDPSELLFAMGVALIESNPFRAPQVLSGALKETTDRHERIEILRYLAWANLSVGNMLEGAERCDEALELAGADDRELILALEGQRYFMRTASLGSEPASSARIQSVASGLKGESPGERVARQALATQRFLACAPVEEVVDLLLPFPDPPWEIEGARSPVPAVAVKILAWCARWDEARAEITRWLEVAHEEGALIAISVGNSFLSEIDRLSGRLPEAEAQARTAWEIAESVGQFSSFGWSAYMNLAATLLARGDLDAFQGLIGGFDLSAGPLEVPLNPWPLEVRANLRLEQGELEAAADDFLALGEALEQIGWLNPIYPPWRQEAAQILAALGRNADAEEMIAVAAKRANAFGSAQGMGTVFRARAFLQPRKSSIEMLNRSVEVFEAHGPPHELARSLIDLGDAMGRDGQRSTAREPLRRALELAHQCGAGGLERRARESLRGVGSRPRRIFRTGTAALTASELRTARLAARGLNNKEIAERLFVTRRTVETHLTHVYQKLGITRRGELATVLTSEAGTPP